MPTKLAVFGLMLMFVNIGLMLFLNLSAPSVIVLFALLTVVVYAVDLYNTKNRWNYSFIIIWTIVAIIWLL